MLSTVAHRRFNRQMPMYTEFYLHIMLRFHANSHSTIPGQQDLCTNRHGLQFKYLWPLSSSVQETWVYTFNKPERRWAWNWTQMLRARSIPTFPRNQRCGKKKEDGTGRETTLLHTITSSQAGVKAIQFHENDVGTRAVLDAKARLLPMKIGKFLAWRSNWNEILDKQGTFF